MKLDEVTGRPVEYAMVTGSDVDRVGTDGSWWRKGRSGWRRRRPRPINYVHLGFSVKKKSLYLHRTILLAFLGPGPADRPLALHIDDDVTNNRLDNLYWGSNKDNTADKCRNAPTRHARHIKRGSLKPDEIERTHHRHGTIACPPENLLAFASPLRSRG